MHKATGVQVDSFRTAAFAAISDSSVGRSLEQADMEYLGFWRVRQKSSIRQEIFSLKTLLSH
jgi:hypothetical protein